jgi:hypothetical protein
MRAASRIALKLRAQRPPAQGGGAADKKGDWRGNAIPPPRAPVSFKRMLGRWPLEADEIPVRILHVELLHAVP